MEAGGGGWALDGVLGEAGDGHSLSRRPGRAALLAGSDATPSRPVAVPALLSRCSAVIGCSSQGLALSVAVAVE